MILLPLAWTLWTVSLWTSGSSQILQQEPVKVLYPAILSTESFECDCANISCDWVYWFRSNSKNLKVQFLGKSNNADRDSYGAGVDVTRIKINKRGSSSFTLRITNVTKEDTGIYSCVLTDRKKTEMWKPGVLLLPGGSPPTLPLPTLPPVKPVCRCPKKKNPPPQAPDACGSLVLWPLVGLISALGLALICTLYYFSRLPKKCRHHFVKKR